MRSIFSGISRMAISVISHCDMQRPSIIYNADTVYLSPIFTFLRGATTSNIRWSSLLSKKRTNQQHCGSVIVLSISSILFVLAHSESTPSCLLPGPEYYPRSVCKALPLMPPCHFAYQCHTCRCTSRRLSFASKLLRPR